MKGKKKKLLIKAMDSHNSSFQVALVANGYPAHKLSLPLPKGS